MACEVNTFQDGLFPAHTHTKQIPTTPRSCKEPLRGRLLLSDHLDVSDMSAFSKHAILWIRGISYLSSFFYASGRAQLFPFWLVETVDPAAPLRLSKRGPPPYSEFPRFSYMHYAILHKANGARIMNTSVFGVCFSR